MTRAMLLCAGLGTRLGPLSDELPKPLLPVAGLPIARYGIALLVGSGIREIVINTHYKAELFARALGDGAALGARIHYIHEPVILGTGGGLKNALHLLDPEGDDEPFVVANGKLIADADLLGLLAAHRAAGEVMATLLVRRVPDALDWGPVEVGADGRIRDVLGARGDHMFCGIHVARPSVIRRLPDGEACSIRQGYLPWLRAGAGEVAAFEHTGYFAEHSTPERYLEGNFAVVGGAALRHPPGPVTGVDPDAWLDAEVELVSPLRVGRGAHIGAGARIGPLAVVGEGAVVAPGARLERSVVWEGAQARGDVRDAIVTRAGTWRAREGR
jgi:NDP-sugar pyrophosphorylase family protein